jgi:succinoglycan biosynthesis protein ExoM
MSLCVAICICTYERPTELARTLTAIERLETPSVPDAGIRVIIVDNARSGSAAAPVAAWKRTSRFASDYHREERKGLSHARNAALRAALASGADYLAFIDDDETPTSGWLESLLAALRGSKAVAAMGPVYPLFAHAPPAWAARGGFYACGNAKPNDLVREGRTGNAIIRCDVLRREGILFESAFNEVGGEDTVFFRHLIARSGGLVEAPDAIVHEWVPPSRLALSWLLRRWFRTGGVEAMLIASSGSSFAARPISGARGLVRICGGSILAVASAVAGGWRDPSIIIARLETVCRGGGMLAGAFGWNYREYAAGKEQPSNDG